MQRKDLVCGTQMIVKQKEIFLLHLTSILRLKTQKFLVNKIWNL